MSKSHSLSVRTAIGGVFLALAVLASSGLGFNQGAGDSKVNLGSVLPDKAPEDLAVDAFGDLGPNWAKWSEETANLVGDLYEDKEMDEARRREILVQLRTRLKTMDTALADSKYRVIHQPLRVLRDRLRDRLDYVDAIATIIDNRPTAASDGVESALRAEIADASASADRFLNTVTSGEQWKAYLRLADLTAAAAASADDGAGLLDIAKAVYTRLDSPKDADDAQQGFLHRFPLQRLRAALSDYISFRESGGSDEFFAGQLTDLVAALESYPNSLRSTEAFEIRSGLRLLKQLSPEGGARLQALLRDKLFNYNMHIAVSENFLSRVASDHRDETGRVADCILGAWVTGCQVSTVNVNVDVVPGSDAARFDLRMDGVARTNTQGRKDPATVYTHGTHYFNGYKSVTFDGTRLSSSQTQLSVDANNTTVGLETDYDWIPLFGAIARGMAAKEVARKRPASEQIAAQKLAAQVIPRFDQEVDDRFARVNSDLESRLFSTLRREDLFPGSMSTRSSDTHIAVSTRTMDGAQVAGSMPQSSPIPMSGFSIQLHESLVNNALDRMRIAGRTLTEEELQHEIERAISDILGRPFEFRKDADTEPSASPVDDAVPADPTADSGEGDSSAVVTVSDQSEEAAAYEQSDDGESKRTTYFFDPTDPIRVAFEDNQFVLILRTGLQQEGEEPIPAQEITIPIEFALQSGKLVLEAGEPRIRPLTDAARFQQITRAAQIRRILKAQLPRREADMSFAVPLDGKPDIHVSVTEFSSADGWLTIVAQ